MDEAHGVRDLGEYRRTRSVVGEEARDVRRWCGVPVTFRLDLGSVNLGTGFGTAKPVW